LAFEVKKMEWTTIQHLDLRHVGREAKPLQPHAAAFHPSQALIAAAVGKYIIGIVVFAFLASDIKLL